VQLFDSIAIVLPPAIVTASTTAGWCLSWPVDMNTFLCTPPSDRRKMLECKREVSSQGWPDSTRTSTRVGPFCAWATMGSKSWAACASRVLGMSCVVAFQEDKSALSIVSRGPDDPAVNAVRCLDSTIVQSARWRRKVHQRTTPMPWRARAVVAVPTSVSHMTTCQTLSYIPKVPLRDHLIQLVAT
jgi:hypothetical protein